jgi:hypothetical protein
MRSHGAVPRMKQALKEGSGDLLSPAPRAPLWEAHSTWGKAERSDSNPAV